MEVVKPAVRWLSSYWEEADILYYFEADEDAWVLRHIELEGPERTPVAAAAFAEWPDPETDGPEAVRAYETKWGVFADPPMGLSDWGFPQEEISRESFERVWVTGRAFLANY